MGIDIINSLTYTSLAQLVRASGLHPEGHRFESYNSYQRSTLTAKKEESYLMLDMLSGSVVQSHEPDEGDGYPLAKVKGSLS